MPAPYVRFILGFRWNVARRRFGASAEEMFLHLLSQPFACARIGERKTILVDEHRLVLQPLLPRFLRHVLENALAELAGIRWKVEAFRLASELHAVDQSCHGVSFATLA